MRATAPCAGCTLQEALVVRAPVRDGLCHPRQYGFKVETIDARDVTRNAAHTEILPGLPRLLLSLSIPRRFQWSIGHFGSHIGYAAAAVWQIDERILNHSWQRPRAPLQRVVSGPTCKSGGKLVAIMARG